MKERNTNKSAEMEKINILNEEQIRYIPFIIKNYNQYINPVKKDKANKIKKIELIKKNALISQFYKPKTNVSSNFLRMKEKKDTTVSISNLDTNRNTENTNNELSCANINTSSMKSLTLKANPEKVGPKLKIVSSLSVNNFKFKSSRDNLRLSKLFSNNVNSVNFNTNTYINTNNSKDSHLKNNKSTTFNLSNVLEQPVRFNTFNKHNFKRKTHVRSKENCKNY